MLCPHHLSPLSATPTTTVMLWSCYKPQIAARCCYLLSEGTRLSHRVISTNGALDIEKPPQSFEIHLIEISDQIMPSHLPFERLIIDLQARQDLVPPRCDSDRSRKTLNKDDRGEESILNILTSHQKCM